MNHRVFQCSDDLNVILEQNSREGQEDNIPAHHNERDTKEHTDLSMLSPKAGDAIISNSRRNQNAVSTENPEILVSSANN
jgi:hypothetical protein